MPAVSRADIVLSSIRTAAAPLAGLADSADVRLLRQMAADFEAEVHSWTSNPPDEDAQELMMQRVLALNVAVAKLVRETTGTAG